VQVAAEFITSAAGAGDFPRDELPEVALIGRSNVGKSTLINALCRRQLARTSAAPGKTRLANFYRVKRGSAPALYLVDLPGYGYARGGSGPGSAEARRQESADEFRRLIDAYFARAIELGPRDWGFGTRKPSDSSGESLEPRASAFAAASADEPRAEPRRDGRKAIASLLLVDARHPGLESDLDAWNWLKTQPGAHGIVATKVDKLTRTERVRNSRQLESLFDVPVLLVSAQHGEGLDQLWKTIASLPSRTAA
jgi:GTP-binding protein